MFCDIAVGDDGGARAGPQRGDPVAERWQHTAADDDVIGAIAERDVDGDGSECFNGAVIAWRSCVGCFFCARRRHKPGVQGVDAFIDDFSRGTSRDAIVYRRR